MSRFHPPLNLALPLHPPHPNPTPPPQSASLSNVVGLAAEGNNSLPELPSKSPLTLILNPPHLLKCRWCSAPEGSPAIVVDLAAGGSSNSRGKEWASTGGCKALHLLLVAVKIAALHALCTLENIAKP